MKDPSERVQFLTDLAGIVDGDERVRAEHEALLMSNPAVRALEKQSIALAEQISEAGNDFDTALLGKRVRDVLKSAPPAADAPAAVGPVWSKRPSATSGTPAARAASMPAAARPAASLRAASLPQASVRAASRPAAARPAPSKPAAQAAASMPAAQAASMPATSMPAANSTRPRRQLHFGKVLPDGRPGGIETRSEPPPRSLPPLLSSEPPETAQVIDEGARRLWPWLLFGALALSAGAGALYYVQQPQPANAPRALSPPAPVPAGPPPLSLSSYTADGPQLTDGKALGVSGDQPLLLKGGPLRLRAAPGSELHLNAAERTLNVRGQVIAEHTGTPPEAITLAGPRGRVTLSGGVVAIAADSDSLIAELVRGEAQLSVEAKPDMALPAGMAARVDSAGTTLAPMPDPAAPLLLVGPTGGPDKVASGERHWGGPGHLLPVSADGTSAPALGPLHASTTTFNVALHPLWSTVEREDTFVAAGADPVPVRYVSELPPDARLETVEVGTAAGFQPQRPLPAPSERPGQLWLDGLQVPAGEALRVRVRYGQRPIARAFGYALPLGLHASGQDATPGAGRAGWQVHVTAPADTRVSSPFHGLTRRDEGEGLVAEGKTSAPGERLLLLAAPPSPPPQLRLWRDENDNALALELRPELPRRSPRAVHFRFVLDRSRSMGRAGLARARSAIVALVGGLRPEDRFSVLACDTRCDALASDPLDATPEHIERLRTFLDMQVPEGATDLSGVLAAARPAMRDKRDEEEDESPDDDLATAVVYIGDGIDALGDGAPALPDSSLSDRFGVSSVLVAGQTLAGLPRARAPGRVEPFPPGEDVRAVALRVHQWHAFGDAARVSELNLPEGVSAADQQLPLWLGPGQFGLVPLQSGTPKVKGGQATIEATGWTPSGALELKAPFAPLPSRLPPFVHAPSAAPVGAVDDLVAALGELYAGQADGDRSSIDALRAAWKKQGKKLPRAQPGRGPARRSVLLLPAIDDGAGDGARSVAAKQAAAAAPEDAGALATLARALAREGDVTGALSALKRWQAAEPDALEAVALRANLLQRHRDARLSVRGLQSLADLAPADPRVHAELGRALDAMGEREVGCQHHRRAAELSPGWDTVRARALSCLTEQGGEAARTRFLAQLEARSHSAASAIPAPAPPQASWTLVLATKNAGSAEAGTGVAVRLVDDRGHAFSTMTPFSGVFQDARRAGGESAIGLPALPSGVYRVELERTGEGADGVNGELRLEGPKRPPRVPFQLNSRRQVVAHLVIE